LREGAPDHRLDLAASYLVLICGSSAHVTFILLAYSRLGVLEGEVLQRAIFLLLLFASSAGKKQNYSRGPAAPAAPLASKPTVSLMGTTCIHVNERGGGI